jgi:hypothetical protein
MAGTVCERQREGHPCRRQRIARIQFDVYGHCNIVLLGQAVVEACFSIGGGGR